MAVSDFTAGFDIVRPEQIGTAEVGDDKERRDGGSADVEQRTGEPDTVAAEHVREPETREPGTREPETAPGPPAEPNSNGGSTAERMQTQPTEEPAPAHDAAPAASVPGIEYGDDDLVRGLETTDGHGTTDDRTSPGRPGTDARDDSSEQDADPRESGAESADDDGEDFFGGLREDPRTSAMQIVDEENADDADGVDAPDFDETIYETRTAAERLEEILLDGKRVLDRREAAKLGGISTVSARKMWRALGMSQAGETDKAYTVSDAHALRIWAKPVADGLIDQTTALSLARAIGQTTDRLVVWQMETLVEFLTEEKGLTDPEARRDALQVVEDMVDPLQKMLTYSWRRNLADVMGRLNVNVSDGLAMDNRQGWYDSSMPLARAVGFIDLVSFTRLSQKMEPRQLADMVQEFQGMAYNIVATGGGRVIKTVGDEVFFAASTPLAGAEIAMTLMERVTAAEDLPQARVGFVWGRVLSRLGDIFGSSVNLAARLTAVAEPGTIFTDEETARVLSASDAYVYEPRDSISLHGLGETAIGEMKRGTAAQMRLDLDDESES
ncbi:adenylate/guanylate cyclase domain-containing protein [Brevibacterium spongiae]|uniref:Adenylate/guanylate cyclase domain-containing protein n=1 Tax=Brevibacterium spongiae TaxID=2909672 RepID=A0ABY5SS71_9MICO|nr:adenylate/guanylate cyclase domain-containing protein [Brevibacterium spongiae]UVI37397.1 adenylate/guanylate cyclase domain-containing protein [Brevibacterium spongiae]